MKFAFTVTAEVNRIEGKFASRDDIGEQIRSELEGCDPGSFTGENGGEYETVSWEVEDA